MATSSHFWNWPRMPRYGARYRLHPNTPWLDFERDCPLVIDRRVIRVGEETFRDQEERFFEMFGDGDDDDQFLESPELVDE